jgi:hypothetical protein
MAVNTSQCMYMILGCNWRVAIFQGIRYMHKGKKGNTLYHIKTNKGWKKSTITDKRRIYIEIMYSIRRPKNFKAKKGYKHFYSAVVKLKGKKNVNMKRLVETRRKVTVQSTVRSKKGVRGGNRVRCEREYSVQKPYFITHEKQTYCMKEINLRGGVSVTLIICCIMICFMCLVGILEWEEKKLCTSLLEYSYNKISPTDIQFSTESMTTTLKIYDKKRFIGKVNRQRKCKDFKSKKAK